MLTKLWRATLLDWTICDYCDLLINYLILADTCGGRGFVLCQINDYAQPNYFSWSSPATSRPCYPMQCIHVCTFREKATKSTNAKWSFTRNMTWAQCSLLLMQSVAAALFKVTLLPIDVRCVKSPKCHYRLTKKCFKLRFRLGFERCKFDFCFGSGAEVPLLPPDLVS